MDVGQEEKKEQLKKLINQLLNRSLPAPAYDWVIGKFALIAHEEGSLQLSMAFAQVARQAGKSEVDPDAPELSAINTLLPGCESRYWSLATIARTGMLLQLNAADADLYQRKISGLFIAAELNELVALYSALPIMAYAEVWINRCEEGIRSNIGNVLEAIMYGNPYPAAFLPEASWNQMVLKAFFTEKKVEEITGLQERNNPALQETLKDYVAERKAAGRSVPAGIFTLI